MAGKFEPLEIGLDAEGLAVLGFARLAGGKMIVPADKVEAAGRAAWEFYASLQTTRGEYLPTWEELSESIRADWRELARQALKAALGRSAGVEWVLT